VCVVYVVRTCVCGGCVCGVCGGVWCVMCVWWVYVCVVCVWCVGVCVWLCVVCVWCVCEREIKLYVRRGNVGEFEEGRLQTRAMRWTALHRLYRRSVISCIIIQPTFSCSS